MIGRGVIFLLCWWFVSGDVLSNDFGSSEDFLENVELHEQAFGKEFQIFLETGNRTKAFNETLAALHLGREFALLDLEDMPPRLKLMSCAGMQ